MFSPMARNSSYKNCSFVLFIKVYNVDLHIVHVSFGECLLKIVEVFATHAPVELFQTRLVQVFEGRPEYFGGDAFLDVNSVFGPVDGRGVPYGESFIG